MLAAGGLIDDEDFADSVGEAIAATYPQLRARGFAAGADWFLDKATEFPRIPTILGELQRASLERAR